MNKTRIGIGVVAASCAAVLQAGQFSDDFVAAARKGSYLSSYAKEFIEVVRSFV